MNTQEQINQLQQQVQDLSSKLNDILNSREVTFKDNLNKITFKRQTVSSPTANGYITVEINGINFNLMKTS